MQGLFLWRKPWLTRMRNSRVASVHADIAIAAQEALQFGLIEAIHEFQPPSGTTLFHI